MDALVILPPCIHEEGGREGLTLRPRPDHLGRSNPTQNTDPYIRIRIYGSVWYLVGLEEGGDPIHLTSGLPSLLARLGESEEEESQRGPIIRVRIRVRIRFRTDL